MLCGKFLQKNLSLYTVTLFSKQLNARMFAKRKFRGQFPLPKTSRRKSFLFPPIFSPKTAFPPGKFGKHVPDVHRRRRTASYNPRRSTVFGGVPWRFSGVVRRVLSPFFQAHEWDDFRALFRGNVATEISHGIPSCEYPTVYIHELRRIFHIFHYFEWKGS